MKRVEIISNTLVPDGDAKEPGVMKTLFVDSVVDLDDAVAGGVVAAGRARYVAQDEKTKKYAKEPKDTTAAHEKEQAARALEVDPAVAQAAAIGEAVANALKALMPAQAPAK